MHNFSIGIKPYGRSLNHFDAAGSKTVVAHRKVGHRHGAREMFGTAVVTDKRRIAIDDGHVYFGIPQFEIFGSRGAAHSRTHDQNLV